jgi:hypothetical protein
MKESVIAETKIIPVGTETTSLSRCVVACIDTFKQAQDIGYQLWEQLFKDLYRGYWAWYRQYTNSSLLWEHNE